MSYSGNRNHYSENNFGQKLLNFFKQVGVVLGLTGKFTYKLRSLVMAIPVFICAGALAIRNARQLPELVGVNITASGDYQWMVSRSLAVWYPFGLTVICLVLMFCSKKVMYPWLVSLLSLVLPIVLLLTNTLSA